MPAPLNANELHLSTPALPATRPSQGEDVAYTSGSMLMFTVDVSLWLAKKLSFSQTILTQNRTEKERLLKKYTLCGCSRMFQNG